MQGHSHISDHLHYFHLQEEHPVLVPYHCVHPHLPRQKTRNLVLLAWSNYRTIDLKKYRNWCILKVKDYYNAVKKRLFESGWFQTISDCYHPNIWMHAKSNFISVKNPEHFWGHKLINSCQPTFNTGIKCLIFLDISTSKRSSSTT